MKSAARRSPLAVLGGLLACYLSVPVLAFAIRIVGSNTRGFRTPGLFPALSVSAGAATISLALMTLLGLPLAYLLARHHGPLAALVGVLVQLPLALPPVMSGILLIYLVGPYTFLGEHLGALTDSLVGVVLAQSFVAAPFLLVTARAAFEGIDGGLLDVAATLGHGELARFFRVALPAAAPGLRAGMLLAWLRAFGEYGATVILAYHPFSLPVYTFNQFSSAGLPTTQAPTLLALGAAAGALGVSRLPFARLLARRRTPLEKHRAVARPPRGESRTITARAAPPLSFRVDHVQGAFHLRAHHEGGGRVAVVGPSGSGKSTLLASLAGLRGAAASSLVLGGRELSARPPEARDVGYLAQGFSLFPHLRVGEQVCFGVGADPVLATEWCRRLRVEALAAQRPGELSGGQRQRVGLAQALARAPGLLLLDEPFGALDAPVRRELQHELRALQRETGVASVVVTHDPTEAALLADEIIVLAEGRVLQQGPVRSVFAAPASAAVAHLLGITNFGEARVSEAGAVVIAGTACAASTGELDPGTPVYWSIPPERLRVTAPSTNGIPARVRDVADLGAVLEIEVELPDHTILRARTGDGCDLVVGSVCSLVLGDALRAWPIGRGAGAVAEPTCT